MMSSIPCMSLFPMLQCQGLLRQRVWHMLPESRPTARSLRLWSKWRPSLSGLFSAAALKVIEEFRTEVDDFVARPSLRARVNKFSMLIGIRWPALEVCWECSDYGSIDNFSLDGSIRFASRTVGRGVIYLPRMCVLVKPRVWLRSQGFVCCCRSEIKKQEWTKWVTGRRQLECLLVDQRRRRGWSDCKGLGRERECGAGRSKERSPGMRLIRVKQNGKLQTR